VAAQVGVEGYVAQEHLRVRDYLLEGVNHLELGEQLAKGYIFARYVFTEVAVTLLPRASVLLGSPSLRLTLLRPLGSPAHRNGGEDDYERHNDSVDELGSQRSSRLTQKLGKQLLDGLVPGQRGHQSQSERDQLSELVQHFGAQLLLLLPYLRVVDFCGHARTVQADPCVHLKPAGTVEK
jgi:hypothetical protein